MARPASLTTTLASLPRAPIGSPTPSEAPFAIGYVFEGQPHDYLPDVVGKLANGKLMQPSAPIADAIPEDFRQVFHQPKMVLDGSGTPWVLFVTR